MTRLLAVKKISHHKRAAGKMESEQHFAGAFTAENSVHFSNPCIRELLDEFLKIPVSTTHTITGAIIDLRR